VLLYNLWDLISLVNLVMRSQSISAACIAYFLAINGLQFGSQLTKITLNKMINGRNLQHQQPPASQNSIMSIIEKASLKTKSKSGMYAASVTISPEVEQKVKPQDLLRKYGPAYLVTSIVLAVISYAICYLLISTGVDVMALLEKVGIKSSAAAANTGTAALAYAFHKAASPIRFPPTVALTPVVARWFGRNAVADDKK
jgi:Protein of unknown function (DUF1279)